MESYDNRHNGWSDVYISNIIKTLFVEGEFDGAQKMYNQLPKNVISELSPDIEVVLNETGFLKNELLNEIRGEYFDKLYRLKNVTASRGFYH